jgi:allose kinase
MSGEPTVAVIDIGGTHVRLGLTGDSASAPLRVSTERLAAGEPVAALRDLVAELRARSDRQPTAIVVGVPGFMDAERRRVIDTPNIPSLRGLPLADALAEACGLPVWLEHDVALQTRGEHRAGAARGHRLVLGVFFGTGVGAGFLRDGRPLVGGPFSMQLGHIPVRGTGRRCACGGIDCIEPYACGRTLDELAQRHGVPVGTLFAASAGADLAAELDAVIESQAIAVATPIMLLDPDVAVIGGGVVAMPGYPFERLRQAIGRRLSPVRPGSKTAILPAALGGAAALQGALGVVAEAAEEAGGR